MKKLRIFTLAAIALLVSESVFYAQIPEFTRIDTGTLVQEAIRGRGVYLVDLDLDGDLDLYIGNSSGRKDIYGKWGTDRPNLLYRNERNCSFVKITEGVLAEKIYFHNPGNNWGDFDNDGDWDLFNYGELFVNDGFGNIEKTITVSDKNEVCGTWIDYNADGYLDIFTNLLSLEYPEAGNFMHKNNGDNTFTLDSVGVATSEGIGEAQSSAWADCDNDGDLDVFVANLCISSTLIPNDLYINEGDGTFSMMSGDSPIVSDTMGAGGGAWGDYDNDGDMDIYVVSFMTTADYLYINHGNLNFERKIIEPEEAHKKYSYGSTWGDFNNDGYLDLFVGVTNTDIDGYYPFTDNLLFMNQGDGTFSRITTGNVITDGAQALATNDIDNDGDLDLIITHGNVAPPYLTYIYKNEGNQNHWLNFTCEGTLSNRSAIGARIRVKAQIGGKEVWMIRELAQENGAHACNGPRLHFGLGDAEIADSIIIRWPSGHVDTFLNVPSNQFYRAIEDSVLAIDFMATNYIQLNPGFADLEFSTMGDSLILDLKEYYKLITGDTVPIITGDTLEFNLQDNENQDLVDVTLVNGMLTLNAGSIEGTAIIKIIASAGFTRRMDQFAVKVVDNTTPPVAIEEISKSGIRIYPNPANDLLTIETLKSGQHSIEITSLNGRLIFSAKMEGTSHQIDLTSFKKGIYFITIRSSDSARIEKIIKLK